jgi:predicted Na+-dependent transporter
MAKPFHYSYRIGLLLVACSPTGIMATVLSKYINQSDYNLVFGSFFLSVLSCVVYIPAILKLLLEHHVHLSIHPIIFQTAGIVIIPYLASRVLISFSNKQLIQRVKSASHWIILVMLFLIITASTGRVISSLQPNSTLLTISAAVWAIYLLQGMLGYLWGYVLGNVSVRNTLAFVCSSRNGQIVLAIAMLNFSDMTAVPVIISIFFHHINNAFWLWLLRERNKHD